MEKGFLLSPTYGYVRYKGFLLEYLWNYAVLLNLH